MPRRLDGFGHGRVTPANGRAMADQLGADWVWARACVSWNNIGSLVLAHKPSLPVTETRSFWRIERKLHRRIAVIDFLTRSLLLATPAPCLALAGKPLAFTGRPEQNSRGQ